MSARLIVPIQQHQNTEIMAQLVEKNGKTYKVVYAKRVTRRGITYYPKTKKYFRFLVEVK